eukprot:gb/GEZN01014732.1/.p1 GENE.gb/GEZN01014732.1/~~gb/GEZN01014732.1/.p1  ORF type:complete len:180 (-),score=25.48 gb/GEZN01014732.1/:351-890(-)
MPKFCGECGTVAGGSKFCASCGAKLPADEPVATSQPAGGVIASTNNTAGLRPVEPVQGQTPAGVSQGSAPKTFVEAGGHEQPKLFFRVKNIPATKAAPCEFSLDGKVLYVSTEDGPIDALFYGFIDKGGVGKAKFSMNLKAVGVNMDKEIIIKKGDHITLEVPKDRQEFSFKQKDKMFP